MNESAYVAEKINYLFVRQLMCNIDLFPQYFLSTQYLMILSPTYNELEKKFNNLEDKTIEVI